MTDDTRIDSIDRDRESGNALILTLIIMIMLGSLAVTYLIEGIAEIQAESTNRLEMALLQDAENALQISSVKIAADEYFPVKDTTNYTYDSTTGMYVGPEEDYVVQGGTIAKIQYSFQYVKAGVPVEFADRSNPADEYDNIRVYAKASKAWMTRTVMESFGLSISESGAFGGAMISDMIPTGATGLDARPQAQSGDIILIGKGRPDAYHIFGNINANGAIRAYDDKSTYDQELTSANIGSYVGTFSGSLQTNLAGTADEIPNVTSLTGADQLFDFDRFIQAATDGAGTVFANLAAFATAMNTANGAGNALEGIIVVQVDPNIEGGGPKLDTTVIPGGINIKGTLLFSFVDGTPDTYKVWVQTPMQINAADLSGLDPADESTYTTGYPPALSAGNKAPYEVDITGSGFDNFKQGDDFPALMFNTGIVDMHDIVNISGVVYGPSLVEIENKLGLTQYVNGAIIAGEGIMLESNSTSGITAIRQDFGTVGNLATNNNMGKTIESTGFTVIK